MEGLKLLNTLIEWVCLEPFSTDNDQGCSVLNTPCLKHVLNVVLNRHFYVYSRLIFWLKSRNFGLYSMTTGEKDE